MDGQIAAGIPGYKQLKRLRTALAIARGSVILSALQREAESTVSHDQAKRVTYLTELFLRIHRDLFYDWKEQASASHRPGTMPEATRHSTNATRHTSHVTRHTPHATRHTSHVTRHTPHATRHTSHATRHTPHVTRHTSHVTRHTPHATRHTPRDIQPQAVKSWKRTCAGKLA
jgi:hypothetical protein